MAPFELNNQACLTGLCGWIANNLTGEGSTLRKIGKKVLRLLLVVFPKPRCISFLHRADLRSI